MFLPSQVDGPGAYYLPYAWCYTGSSSIYNVNVIAQIVYSVSSGDTLTEGDMITLIEQNERTTSSPSLDTNWSLDSLSAVSTNGKVVGSQIYVAGYSSITYVLINADGLGTLSWVPMSIIPQ